MNIQLNAGTTFCRNHLDNNISTVLSFSLMAILFYFIWTVTKEEYQSQNVAIYIMHAQKYTNFLHFGVLLCFFFLFQLVLSYFIRSSDANTYPLWNNEHFRLLYFVMFICFSIYQIKHWKKWRAGWSWPILYFIYLLEKKELCKNISQIFEFQS